MAESVLLTPKTEFIDLKDFDTRGHAQTPVFDSIEVFDNCQRCHAAHGDLAPLEYEQVFNTAEMLRPKQC